MQEREMRTRKMRSYREVCGRRGVRDGWVGRGVEPIRGRMIVSGHMQMDVC